MKKEPIMEARAAIADERAKTLTRSQLAEKAGEFGKALAASAWDLSLHEQRDKEVPATDDPELLERARQATDFLKARVAGGSVPNRHTVQRKLSGFPRIHERNISALLNRE
ncbi:hypothetical protein QTI33_00035 [Variovorax sp. J22P271]|uniref:hypothetical protein n=1 Tax=Variovorax davisae TaxID=3053515 RepID=UPI00257532A6|nr:hypothetical protein [Variovorax sp. J22P271]MDM0030527.1 hypothetical protein [Variovorax sp. J22P271]